MLLKVSVNMSGLSPEIDNYQLNELPVPTDSFSAPKCSQTYLNKVYNPFHVPPSKSKYIRLLCSVYHFVLFLRHVLIFESCVKLIFSLRMFFTKAVTLPEEWNPSFIFHFTILWKLFALYYNNKERFNRLLHNTQ